MLKKLVSLFSISLILLVPFDISGQQKKNKRKKNTSVKEKSTTESKNGIKKYNEVITEKAVSDTGLFTVHRVNDNFFFEIPNEYLNQELLMVTRISKTASGLGYGGGKTNTQVLKFEKNNKKVLLKVISYSAVAADSLPIHEAVVNSNLEPILYAFPIKAFNSDSSTVVIDVTNFYKGDTKTLGLHPSHRKRYKVKKLDPNRSYINEIRSYPINIEVRSVKTYEASEPPSNASTGAITVEVSNSLLLLPQEKMKRRIFDKRVGWFTRSQIDYGLENQRTKSITYLDRWKLEVKDEDIEKFKRGELVVPKKQIVYYIDRATPKKWVKYLKQGIEDWQVAFEAAGFKDAIIAKDPPTKEEDPDWSPEDARYSVVRYLASNIPNAYGPHVSDPRTGEILEADINWYHNVMLLLHNWFFIQTAAFNPDARSADFKEEIMGRLIRFVSSHEVGHTLGLPHNMGASAAYPVDSLRSASFTKKYGTAPSIMDYARFNYVAQPGDKNVSLMPNIGIYDKYAIRWGYKPILDAKTENDEKPTLDKWILEHQNDPMYRFGDQQSRSKVIDPNSQTEDLGDDPIKASVYGIANLKRIVPKLIEWTSEDGKDYSELETMYKQVISQLNRYSGHVTANIGGVYKHHKTSNQPGKVYTNVPRQKQLESMQFLNEQIFSTPEWLLDNEIFDRIESTGNIERIRDLQTRTLNNLLNSDRMIRMIENETANSTNSYSLMDMMDDLRNGIWSELKSGKKIDTYRRNIQRSYLSKMNDLTKNKSPLSQKKPKKSSTNNTSDVNLSDIKPIVRYQLKKLKQQAKSALPRTSDKLSKIHLEDVVSKIDNILNPKFK